MSQGPFYLRFRADSAPKPEIEQFPDLDAALDAVEARWATLRDQAPQILDGRKVLILSTDELRGEFDAAEQDKQ
ncbi:hypothetical protein [Falsiroseomonas sp. HW251]|uniref:hypothetical protein n=1 Tax=Falsiroseomonas sp. HW251 TaxID=3390998 RepID=UPI003D31A28F